MITFRKLGKFGRFGNQLFQYAGTRLYAELNNFEAVFPKWIGNEIFQGVNGFYNPVQKIKALFLSTRQLDDLRSYDKIDQIKFLIGLKKRLPETINIKGLYSKPEDNINLYSHFQDEFSLELFKKQKNLICMWFSFKPEIENEYKKITDHLKPWIGIHIRHGDFVKRDLAVPTIKYLELLKKISNGKNLYIASDDRTITADFKEFKLIKISNPLSDVPDFIFDFWMLKNAENVLGCGSTFSWWAAFLNKKAGYFSPPLTHLWAKDYKPILEKIIL